MTQATIQRGHHDREYTVIGNATLQNDSLSWKARGLLAYLLSLPENWKVHVSELSNHSTDGDCATRSAFKELEAAGHIVRHDERDNKGRRVALNYFVYEHPQNLNVENLNMENLDLGFQQLQSTQEQSTHKEIVEATPQQADAPAERTPDETSFTGEQIEMPGVPTLEPDSPEDKILFDALAIEAVAKGRRPPTKFSSLASKQVWRGEVVTHFNGDLRAAILKAMARGITGRDKLITYLAGWAKREAEGAPVPVRAGDSSNQERMVWYGS